MTARFPRPAALVLVAIVCVSFRAAADAPTNPPQYDAFTQDDPTIRDRFTKLEWERSVVENAEMAAADLHCTTLAFAATGGAGRLPTVKELMTLIDEEPHLEYETRPPPPRNVAKLIDRSAFDGAPVDLPYWTQTPAESGKFWTLHFSTGEMEARAPSERAHTRCVR